MASPYSGLPPALSGMNNSIQSFNPPVVGSSAGGTFLGSLVGIGRDFLQYYLNKSSADTAYERQRELMELSQEYNSIEAQKQRDASSLSHIYKELTRLGLNPDLIYQNGASQGSMSNAASAGAPSVMPANVGTFNGIFDAMSQATQQQNADTNSAIAQLKSEEIRNLLDVQRATIKKIGADTFVSEMEGFFKSESMKDILDDLKAKADISTTQAEQIRYLTVGILLSLYYEYGAKNLSEMGIAKSIVDKDGKVVGLWSPASGEFNAYLNNRIAYYTSKIQEGNYEALSADTDFWKGLKEGTLTLRDALIFMAKKVVEFGSNNIGISFSPGKK